MSSAMVPRHRIYLTMAPWHTLFWCHTHMIHKIFRCNGPWARNILAPWPLDTKYFEVGRDEQLRGLKDMVVMEPERRKPRCTNRWGPVAPISTCGRRVPSTRRRQKLNKQQPWDQGRLQRLQAGALASWHHHCDWPNSRCCGNSREESHRLGKATTGGDWGAHPTTRLH